MNGIINFLNKESKNNIDEKIKFTASGICSNSDLPQNVALHNDHYKYFESSNNLNSWICLDFKDKRVIPTDFKDNTNYIRNWRIMVYFNFWPFNDRKKKYFSLKIMFSILINKLTFYNR